MKASAKIALVGLVILAIGVGVGTAGGFIAMSNNEGSNNVVIRNKEEAISTSNAINSLTLGSIEDDVEIGANCQVAKGVLSDTIIGNGCKINGLSFIAHNCVLEENVWITGDTMLCGTTHVKKNSTIFSNVIVRDQTIIGENVTVGMGSVVTKNIPDGEVWFGAPAHKKD